MNPEQYLQALQAFLQNLSDMQNLMLGAGCLTLVVALHFYVERRRFNRRNSAGVELFRDYKSKVANRVYEFLLTLVQLPILIGGGWLVVRGGVVFFR